MELKGVITTGIYCRADCAARPDARNVRPMRSAAEAMAAGFRPCLVCRPDRLPEGELGGLAHRPAPRELAHALRLIAEGFLDGASAEQLAEATGYSARHLSRLFEEHIGASPDFVARARRAHLARRLLDETELAVVDVAFAAGFSSLRQMNRVMRELFGFTPSALRAKRTRGAPLDALDGGLRLRVPFRGPLDVETLMTYLAGRAIPGVECVDGQRYRRTMNSCGHPGVVDVTDEARNDPRSTQPGLSLQVTLHLPSFGSIIDHVSQVRRLFSLDVEAKTADRFLGEDDLLGSLVSRRPGLRLPGAWDRFETSVRIIVGQQVSVAGASTITGRLAERFGMPIEASLPGGLSRLFPSAATLAQADLGKIGMPTARARTITAFAQAVDSGALELSRVASLEETLATLQALPGIGPWTAHFMAARVFGQEDAFPAGDLGLRKQAGVLLGRDAPLTAAELEQRAEAWRPHRSLAAAHLWMMDRPRPAHSEDPRTLTTPRDHR